MLVSELLEEYGLEIDDIRWFLSNRKAGELLELKEKPVELAKFIWSKGLEDSLYNMEERFIEDLQDEYDRKLVDEPYLRELCLEALSLKRKRY